MASKKQELVSKETLIILVVILGAFLFTKVPLSETGNIVYERTIPRQEVYSFKTSQQQSAPLIPECCELGTELEIPIGGGQCKVIPCSLPEPKCDPTADNPSPVIYTGTAKPSIILNGKKIQPPADQTVLNYEVGEGGNFDPSKTREEPCEVVPTTP